MLLVWLEHVGYLIPLMRHFLGRLCCFKDAVVRKVLQYTTLSANIKYDLRTHLRFLDQA
jgi:hypothetical protein